VSGMCKWVPSPKKDIQVLYVSRGIGDVLDLFIS
jgi:hypothetical protein